MTPNPALHPTAKRLRHLVPFSLRSSAAGEGKRWADLGELGLCRSRLQRRRMLRLVDAEFPAAWQRKPRDRAPALLVDGRALHVLLLHLGDERLHVVAH